MHISSGCIVLLALPQAIVASPARLAPRDEGSAKITQMDTDPMARAKAVAVNRAGYQYAPSLMGKASYHLGGSLGEKRIESDLKLWLEDRNIVNRSLSLDVAAASAAVTANFGLRSVRDYETILYDGQWNRAVPGGEAPGMLSNYTQDLLFSMERLSLNPFPLRRIKTDELLPFTIPSDSAIALTGQDLDVLQLAGRLFVVDHSYQAKYEKSERFGAATTALFFIHPQSGDFLPLAIKTNVDADLVYTPLDSANDWLLAKMMFNVNDILHSQMFHLAASHDVGEVVHEAALRTLSFDHPVMIILERLMYQAFAVRVYGDANLVQPGGPIDQAFYVNANGAREFVAEWYPIVGRYQSNYLNTFLEAQGLIKESWSPALKSFPFYSDAEPLNKALEEFFIAFVDSYYTSDDVIATDIELQNWFAEANGPAEVLDFPTKPSKKVLIEVLTHFAFLTGVSHHALNTGDPSATKAVLPFHPASLYAPIPKTKNVTDLLPFLPPPKAALFHIAIFGAFTRAHLEETNRTLAYMFSDEGMLGRLNKETRAAAGSFFDEMKSISTAVRARKFDANGLCQGMPFVWRSLDPGSVPFFFAV